MTLGETPRTALLLFDYFGRCTPQTTVTLSLKQSLVTMVEQGGQAAHSNSLGCSYCSSLCWSLLCDSMLALRFLASATVNSLVCRSPMPVDTNPCLRFSFCCVLLYQICLCQSCQVLQVVADKLLKACFCIAPACMSSMSGTCCCTFLNWVVVSVNPSTA